MKNKPFAKTVARAVVPVLLVPSLAFSATTYDRARVVGVDPIYETISYEVPVQECRDEQVRYDAPAHNRPARSSATAPILGALIGGAIGNAVGHKKRNKQVGAVLGAVLGGSIGADIARRNRGYHNESVDYRYEHATYRTEQVCHTVQELRSEERFTGYNVSYEYAGRTYMTKMQRDPGRTIRVRVAVSPAE